MTPDSLTRNATVKHLMIEAQGLLIEAFAAEPAELDPALYALERKIAEARGLLNPPPPHLVRLFNVIDNRNAVTERYAAYGGSLSKLPPVEAEALATYAHSIP